MINESTLDVTKVKIETRKKQGKESEFEWDDFKFKVGTMFTAMKKQCVYINTGGWVRMKDEDDDFKTLMERFKRQFKVWSYQCIPTVLKGIVEGDFIIRDIHYSNSHKNNTTQYSYVTIDLTFFLLDDEKYYEHFEKIELICQDIMDFMVENPDLEFVGTKKHIKKAPK